MMENLSMRKIKFLIALCCAFHLCSCHVNGKDTNYQKDEQGFYQLPAKEYDLPLSDDGNSEIKYTESLEKVSSSLRLYGEGKKIPLYPVMVNLSQSWTPNHYSRQENSVGIIQKKGPITLTLATNFTIQHGVTIRPLSSNVEYKADVEKRLITFTIEAAGQYTIEFRMNRTLHLFIDEMNLYDDYREKENVLYFGPGVHNHQNDARINSANILEIHSNQTVYLDYGAVFQGGILSNSATDIAIVGGGIIDGSVFERDAEKGTRLIPLDLNYCKRITIEGISCLDPAGWTYNMYFAEDLAIRNIKIISSRSNGDGISLQSCKRVHVDDSFIRTWDDSLVVKNYPHWSNRNWQGETEDIYFSQCILWTDLAQSMEIGYETIGVTMKNIYFTNIIVLHNYHKAIISIHNGNNAHVSHVIFRNIIVEDASVGLGDGSNVIIDFSTAFSSTWSTNHVITELGEIDDVLLQDVQVLSGHENAEIRVMGTVDTREGYSNTIHPIKNIRFQNVYFFGTKVTQDYAFLQTNQYVENMIFL